MTRTPGLPAPVWKANYDFERFREIITSVFTGPSHREGNIFQSKKCTSFQSRLNKMEIKQPKSQQRCSPACWQIMKTGVNAFVRPCYGTLSSFLIYKKSLGSTWKALLIQSSWSLVQEQSQKGDKPGAHHVKPGIKVLFLCQALGAFSVEEREKKY